jgi:aspartate/methionine/tyrosine aminotransferase
LRAPFIYRLSSPPLNPLRNWADHIRQDNDQKYARLNAESGFERPEKIIQFLEGDPTKYSGFKTPHEFKEIAAKSVGQHDG